MHSSSARPSSTWAAPECARGPEHRRVYAAKITFREYRDTRRTAALADAA